MGEAGKKDWGYGFAQLPANGNSGGIILFWDTRVFTCKEAVGDERFVAVKGLWMGKVEDIFLVCVYGPHVSCQKALLWERLARLMDRFNSQVNVKQMNDFNDFINDTRSGGI
ncbi:hypothetical protein CTI12_AA513860 [Artemisia annua]|uniref:Uncharacterized protein n=1 Tax=Artemisia annua TaxID=35608 RepID=A0A2U1L9H9_ARTAN|nr:hypothetical protein CTI12_AA513860 [Artemisia annua]